MKVNSLKRNAPNFPPQLTHIDSPPKQIFWAGIDPGQWLDKPRVAIVGSRKISPYGRQVTERLATELAQAGVVIISGLAYGVDITAHKAALKAGGLTVAILPSDIAHIYPAAHNNIAKEILTQGCLISEYGRGQPTYKQNFIARNRLISGLCDGLLITEAAINSGSLHTARFALEQGKTVMAVPGNITSPTSEGANNLIKSGAVPVCSTEDIFFALNIKPKKISPLNPVFRGTKTEEIVLQLIRGGLHSQEEISIAARLDGPAIAGALTMLEISGYIRPTGGGNWAAV